MKHTLLLIEDNPDDLALVLRAIERSALDIETVVHSDIATSLNWLLNASRDRYTVPALILLDLNPHQIDGVGFLQRLRADSLTCAVPVVIYSGDTEETALKSCLAAGCNSFVRKPVRYSDFVETVQQIIRYWLLINETASIKA